MRLPKTSVTQECCGAGETYESPPCPLEHDAKKLRATLRSPKSVALPVVAMVM